MPWYILCSKCFVECGTSSKGSCSELGRGLVATKGNSAGQKVYNFYGCGATDQRKKDSNGDKGPLQTGTTYASNKGWTDERKAIIGGIGLLKSYCDNGQTSGYLQKYNLVMYANNKIIGNQYATAINYAYKGSETEYKKFKVAEDFKLNFYFSLPVFKEE